MPVAELITNQPFPSPSIRIAREAQRSLWVLARLACRMDGYISVTFRLQKLLYWETLGGYAQNDVPSPSTVTMW